MCILTHRKPSSTGIQRLSASYMAPFSGATLSLRFLEDLSAKNSQPTGTVVVSLKVAEIGVVCGGARGCGLGFGSGKLGGYLFEGISWRQPLVL